MIVSPIHIKYFKSEDTLFKQVDKVLEKNALYNIDIDKDWFILSYWFGNLYEIQETDYRLDLRLGTPYYGRDIRLYWGDILVLDAVAVHQSWFYYPRLLISQRERHIINARGYTKLGNVFALIRAGILRKIDTPEDYF